LKEAFEQVTVAARFFELHEKHVFLCSVFLQLDIHNRFLLAATKHKIHVPQMWNVTYCSVKYYFMLLVWN